LVTTLGVLVNRLGTAQEGVFRELGEKLCVSGPMGPHPPFCH
jgi:hypothetical protein